MRRRTCLGLSAAAAASSAPAALASIFAPLASFGAVAAAAAALAGCATAVRTLPGERIAGVAAGTVDGTLSFDELMQRMLACDLVLLGERHDNPHHHARRAAVLAALPAPTTVVAEHLPRGSAPRLSQAGHAEPIKRELEAAGFDAKGWRWPLHEPLFAAVARAGHTLVGGNLPREPARRVVREGAAALADELRAMVEAAPLSPAARQALEADLQSGHCGHLPAHLAPGMLMAQRGRDAAMVQAVLLALDPARAGGSAPRPVVLLAGNGHVRRDYGVPQLLSVLRPSLRVLSVGFVEPGEAVTHGTAALYDITWSTPAPQRTDPCADLKPIGATPPALNERP